MKSYGITKTSEFLQRPFQCLIHHMTYIILRLFHVPFFVVPQKSEPFTIDFHGLELHETGTHRFLA